MLARYVAAVALLALAAAPVRAQDTTTRARPPQDTSEHPGAWLLGVGVNLNQGQTGIVPALQLGREWRAPTSRFGLRLNAAFSGRTERALSYYGGNGQPLWSARDSYADASVSLLTTFALTKGRIQPYLLSGFALQRRQIRTEYVDFTNPGGVPGGGSLNFAPGTYRSTLMDFGAEAGFGVQARVGRAWVYVENKAQFFGDHSSRRSPHPFTLGIRF